MPTGEMVHISALERLGNRVAVDGKPQIYKPKNLLAVIPYIRATYTGRTKSDEAIDVPVVDWSGNVLEPEHHHARKKVLDVLPRAENALEERV
jgi:hypothetical protein